MISNKNLLMEIDTHRGSFQEIAKAVSEKLNNNNLELVRYALPTKILMLPEKVSLESLETLQSSLNAKDIKKSGVVLGELARQAIVKSGGSPTDLSKIKELVVEIISSILLNLGGTRQLEGGYSQRLQDFAELVSKQLPTYKETTNNNILQQSQEHSLKQIFLEVNQLIQSLDKGDAISQLVGTLPDQALKIALSRFNDITPLLDRWCLSVDNISNSIRDKTEEAVVKSIAYSMSELLNIMGFLLANESLERIIESTQEWITGFFTNASGGTPVNIDITRLLGVLRKGASLNKDKNDSNDRGRNVTERLIELGVRLDEIREEVKHPLLTTLNPEGETDEMFTGRLLIENGKISPGLAIIVKTSPQHGIHVFVYDRNGIEEWIRTQTTVPETRERFGGRVISIS